METLYPAAFIVSALICLSIAVAAWGRRPAPGALGLAILCAGQFWWSASFALQWLLTNQGPSRFWFLVRLAGLQITPTAILILVLDFTGRRGWLTRRNVLLLLVQPILFYVLAVTDPMHGLYLGGRPPALRLIAGGPAFGISVLYSYGLLVVAGVLLIARLVKLRAYRMQTAVLLIAVMLPVAHFVAQLRGFDLLPKVNSVPFTYTLTGIMLWYALTRLGLFRVIPIARDQLVEQMPEGIVVFDSSAQIVDINHAALRMTGISSACVGQTADEAFPHLAQTITALRAGLATGDGTSSVRAEFGVSSTMEVTASVVNNHNGERLATLVTLRDITSQTRAAAELEERSEQLNAALDCSSRILAAMTDGVLLVDADGTLLQSNDAAHRILDVDLAARNGSSVDGLLPTLSARTLTAEATTTGHPISAQLDLEDGRSLTVEVIPLLEAESHRAQTLLILRDETERHVAERMQRDFVANVAHELQTPLTGLSLLADTIPRALREDLPSATKFVQRLGVEVERLIRMTNELMALSRADEPAGPDSGSPVDLAHLVTAEVAEIDHLAHAKRLDISLDTPDALLVIGDEVAFALIVGNLVENAVRYTGEGGHIEVRLRSSEDPDGCRYAELDVTDTGVGIPGTELERIWERFYRLDKARSRRNGGAGLGLSIVRQTVERHGGTVDVKSVLGEGSTFSVRLPL